MPVREVAACGLSVMCAAVDRPAPSAWSSQGGGGSKPAGGGQTSLPHRAAPVAPSRPVPSVPQRMAPSPTPVGNIPAALPPPLIPS